ncbi:MAG: glycosyltransferase, partial [Lachnospiraceae bacterium]
MKRLLLFQPGVETLRFFSDRLAEEFQRMGYEVRLVRIHEPFFGLEALRAFIVPNETVMITFNFHAIQKEAIFYTPEGELLWDLYDVACINIIVDHPFYYYEELKHLPRRYLQICIDGDHADYMKRFYPDIACGKTMPLAGCDYRSGFSGGIPYSGRMDVLNPATFVPNCFPKTLSLLPIKKRSTDVVFTGCFTQPDFFLPYMKRNGEEYDAFYHGILDDLLADPDQCIHTVYLRHLNRELPELTEEDLKNVMNKMIFLDLWIRFTFRGKVIQTLLEADIPVHCIGAGWETLSTTKRELLTHTAYSDTAVCLKAISEAKISLNVMPWFKRGSHDRIYSSMLNGSVCVTDTSQYLLEHFKDGDTLCYYHLKQLSALPSLVSDLLANPQKMQQIADRGRT